MCPMRVILCVIPLVVAGCQAPSSAPARPAADAVSATPAAGVVPGDAERYVIEPEQSELRLLVYRAGALARLGHNHVITGTPEGEIWLADPASDSGFRLTFASEDLVVDDANVRSEEGAEFAAAVPESAREATVKNMLGEQLLDAVRYPHIEVSSVAVTGPAWNPDVTARVVLAGNAQDLEFPAAVWHDGDRLVVVARFTFLQSSFGIEPFSVLGGGLRVADEVLARLRITARRAPAR